MTYDGVVLAGGAGRRLGGLHKSAISVGGRRLLDVVVEALHGAETTIAVGPPLPSTRPVVWTCETPAGGGPVAAIGAAIPLVRCTLVVVLATDLPFVTRPAVDRLVAAHGDAAVTVAVDAAGHDQPLLACYDVELLTAAMPAPAHNTSMRSLLRDIEAVGKIRRVALGGDPPVTWDCDTAADLSHVQELA